MTKDLSPEERLLELIKGTDKKDASATGQLQQQAEAESQKEAVATRERFPNNKGKKVDLFKITVFLLTGLFIIGAFYFTYELFGRKQQAPIIDVDKLIQMGAETAQEEKPIQKPTEEKSASAEDQVPPEEEFPQEARELFGAPATRETSPLIKEGPSISELAMGFVLLGVITGDNPQAIIQDKRTRQTYYVYEGEGILEFKIKKVEKATVILERNGEVIKLSL